MIVQQMDPQVIDRFLDLCENGDKFYAEKWEIQNTGIAIKGKEGRWEIIDF